MAIITFCKHLPVTLKLFLKSNHRFLNNTCKDISKDIEKIRRLSLIDETGERQIRMANLACVGSHSINGVSKLHTELLKHDVLKDFYELWPEKFNNKTNGVTPRRFVMINPRLTNLINAAIGDGWIKNLDQLRNLEKFTRIHHLLKNGAKLNTRTK